MCSNSYWNFSRLCELLRGEKNGCKEKEKSSEEKETGEEEDSEKENSEEENSEEKETGEEEDSEKEIKKEEKIIRRRKLAFGQAPLARPLIFCD